MNSNPSHDPRIFASDFQERSYWWHAFQDRHPQNTGLVKSVDVAIVGGGVTGVSAALELAAAGQSVAVFDAGAAGYGASSRNTGFLGRFLKTSFADLSSKHGTQRASALYAELFQALNVSLIDVVSRHEIDCDLTFSGRVVLARSPSQLRSLVHEFQLRREHLQEEVRILDRAALQREIRCSEAFCGGVLVPDMATIHPGKYHAGLLAASIRAGASIYNHVRVSDIQQSSSGYAVATSLGTVDAKHVIVATNGYTGDDLPWFSRRLVPFEGFAIATDEVPDLDRVLPTNRSYTDANFDTMAIRLTPDGKRVILSGRTGRTMPLKAKAALLREDLISALPALKDVKLSYAWSGYCAAPLDTMPKVGQRPDGVWFATGFTFMGMPQGSYLGRKVAFQILGRPEGHTIFSDMPFKASPFYTGRPWFLPALMTAMRFKDFLGNRQRADHGSAIFPRGHF